jgi:hypothetical protein
MISTKYNSDEDGNFISMWPQRPASPKPFKAPGRGLTDSSDPWIRLALYQSRDLLAARYVARHGRTPNDGKCREIAAHLAQGAQYFESSRTAGSLARPLLLYYGVLALTRALILFSKPSLREAGLSEGHGVSVHGWSNLLAGQNGLPSITRLPLHIQRGTFRELATATVNAEWTQVGWANDVSNPYGFNALSGYWGWTSEGTANYPDGLSVNFGDVLARIPDLAALYEETIGESAASFPTDVVIYRGPFNMGHQVPPVERSVRISVSRNHFSWSEAAERAEFFALSGDWAVHTTQRDQRVFSYECNSKDGQDDGQLIRSLPPIRTTNRWINYSMMPFPGEVVMSTMSLLFLASYASGMLVRYFPTTWSSLGTASAGDRVAPLLAAATNHITTRYPLEVAEYFDGPDVVTGKVYEFSALPN